MKNQKGMGDKSLMKNQKGRGDKSLMKNQKGRRDQSLIKNKKVGEVYMYNKSTIFPFKKKFCMTIDFS